MDGSEAERIEKAEILRGPDLLKLLPPDTRLFDNVSTSDGHSSELSHPFSDIIYNVETESRRKAKELYGKDLYAAFSFSSEFKSAIAQLKKEMIAENPNYLNIDSMIAAVQPEPPVRKEPSFNIPLLPGIDFEVESAEEGQEERKRDAAGKDRKKLIWQDEEESVFDTMSGYWRLLSVFDEFRISPPWYDAYADGKEHWLNTRPIPPDVLENSRKKCLNWLSKYFDA